jgi:hypothetical protein
MRKVAAAVIAVVLVAIVAYIALHRRNQDGDNAAARAGSAGGAATRSPDQPSLGSALDPKDPVAAKFLQRKAEALEHLQADLEARLRTCEQPAGSGSGASTAAPPRPRTVAVTLDWDEHLSTPELQRYVVDKAEVVQANDPVSPSSLRCLDRLQGSTLNVLLHVRDLPPGQQHLQELVSLPLH